MRISSFKKIEKQAAEYAESVFSVSTDDKKQIEILEQQLSEFSKQWSKLRDSYCDGSPCICKSHPRHKEFSDKIDSVETPLKQVYTKLVKEKNELKRQKEKQLIDARLSKLKYQSILSDEKE